MNNAKHDRQENQDKVIMCQPHISGEEDDGSMREIASGVRRRPGLLNHQEQHNITSYPKICGVPLNIIRCVHVKCKIVIFGLCYSRWT